MTTQRAVWIALVAGGTRIAASALVSRFAGAVAVWWGASNGIGVVVAADRDVRAGVEIARRISIEFSCASIATWAIVAWCAGAGAGARRATHSAVRIAAHCVVVAKFNADA